MLRYVLVSFGEEVGIGTTLTAALDDVLGISDAGGRRRPRRHRTGHGRRTGGPVSGDVRQLLRQAEAKFAAAQKALQAGDLEGYATAQADARDLVQQALVEAGGGAFCFPLGFPLGFRVGLPVGVAVGVAVGVPPAGGELGGAPTGGDFESAAVPGHVGLGSPTRGGAAR